MKVNTLVDNWGGVRLDIIGESVHENALLELLARKGIASTSIGAQAGSDSPIEAVLTFSFYAHPLPEQVANPSKVVQQ
jgi:hypothetical protein